MIYVDPLLAPQRPAQSPANILYEDLAAQLIDFRQRWSRLPQLALPAGRNLQFGDRDERVVQLRRRLAIAPGSDPSRFDAAVVDAVTTFRVAHGLGSLGSLDRATLSALNAGEEAYEAIARRNLDRLLAIPANPGPRYIVVDAAGAQLWLIENGRIVDTMRVVVGKREMPTPQMAAYIRFVVFNPYWNIPPDLVRDSIAPKVLAQGPGYLLRQRLELLSGWSEDARILTPEEVDWAAIAAGTAKLRVRQLPGDDNFMGKVKFMLPNRMGIYLHDTPNKAVFTHSDRRLSSGCVRLEDAAKLATWLLGRSLPAMSSQTAEKRIDLAQPVPVYITYLTAAPGPAGIRFQTDGYGRDANGSSF